MSNIYSVKGNILYTKDFGSFEIVENGYIVVEDEKVRGVYNKLPIEFENVEETDYKDKLIIPGFVDLHLHGPQFPNLGLGLDEELMPWLEKYTFPEEAKYLDNTYAKKVYSLFIRELWRVGTTRATVFASIHKESSKILMELFNEAGLGAYVGKVNMDRNCPDFLKEDTKTSLKDTEEIIVEYKDKFKRVKPIITPRFVPTCSLELLDGLGELAKKYDIPVQSHLSENTGEIKFVKELHPDFLTYSSIYDHSGLLGDVRTIMAHCVLLEDSEIELIKTKDVFIAHCPNSNLNLASGIAPIRKLISKGIKVGLATDIAGGHTISMMKVIASAAQVSNLIWLNTNKKDKQLTVAELFYLATKGGGEFFGNVGSFEEGYDFDALVIDDIANTTSLINDLTIEERLQKYIYTGDEKAICARYVAGMKIEEPKSYS